MAGLIVAKHLRRKRLLLPLALFVFQAIFLVLLGALVEYETGASPDALQSLLNSTQLERSGIDVLIDLESRLGTRGTYACAL